MLFGKAKSVRCHDARGRHTQSRKDLDKLRDQFSRAARVIVETGRLDRRDDRMDAVTREAKRLELWKDCDKSIRFSLVRSWWRQDGKPGGSAFGWYSFCHDNRWVSCQWKTRLVEVISA